MTEATLNFIYQGSTIKIQSKRNEYMKDIFKRYANKISKDTNDIYFMSNGSKINEESKLEEINNSDNVINILVNDINDKNNKNKEEKQNKDIICPECGEICLIDINDYKLILSKCINKHSTENILLDEFNDLQNNKELNILCNECNKNRNEIYKNQLYKCCNCNKNICPICKSKHDKNHILIDFELKNYLCNVHGERYMSYCETCNKNLCDLCELEHNKNHNFNYLNKLITNKENNANELRIKIDNLKKEVNNIIDKLNKIVDNLEIYYYINNSIINNYNIKNKNYEVLMNINNIYNFNEIIIKDINEITNENKIENKIKYINNIYDKMITRNEFIIKYKAGKEDKIRVFGDKFVENNKNNFQMIINDNIYELNSFYNIKNEKENEKIEIKLKQIKDATNISYMFDGCLTLTELANISKY